MRDGLDDQLVKETEEMGIGSMEGVVDAAALSELAKAGDMLIDRLLVAFLEGGGMSDQSGGGLEITIGG